MWNKKKIVEANYQPAVIEHLTPKIYVDNAIDEISLVGNNQNNDINNHNLTNINSITLNTQAVEYNQVITKAYVDHFHQDNERSRLDLRTDFYDDSSDLVKNNQDANFNKNKWTNLDSITVDRVPISDNELANKKYIDDELDKNAVLRFNQTLENYLKVSVGDDVYNFAKNGKLHNTDTTIIGAPNTGKDLLQRWNINCNDKNSNSQIGNFVKSTKRNSPTDESGATVLTPMGNSFMYIETSSDDITKTANVILKRTDVIQITNFSFSYNRFSILTDDSLKSMGVSLEFNY